MPVLTELKELLDRAGVPYQVSQHPPAYTAQEVAEAEHVPGREVAKVVVIRGAQGFALFVAPAPYKVDLARVQTILGDPQAKLATEDEFRHLFPRCEVGAMPPFGNLFGLPVYVDPELARDETIVFNAGTHTQTVHMRYADFERLVQPTTVAFAHRN
ncbi:MAG: YbaK/EbsC family protein [Candidatus Binatia bacterium]|nr:YbaK/EbsC family protein [Candidatus Binatia bacterium]